MVLNYFMNVKYSEEIYKLSLHWAIKWWIVCNEYLGCETAWFLMKANGLFKSLYLFLKIKLY